MQLPQNSNMEASWLPPHQTWASLLSSWPFHLLIECQWWVWGEPRLWTLGGLASRLAPRPMGRLEGSCVTITEGHNQRGKFAEPYSLSGPAGACFFQLFWGKECESMNGMSPQMPPKLSPHMLKPLSWLVGLHCEEGGQSRACYTFCNEIWSVLVLISTDLKRFHVFWVCKCVDPSWPWWWPWVLNMLRDIWQILKELCCCFCAGLVRVQSNTWGINRCLNAFWSSFLLVKTQDMILMSYAASWQQWHSVG